jgi:hypothetical protein
MARPHVFGFAFRRIVLNGACAILGVLDIEEVRPEEAGRKKFTDAQARGPSIKIKINKFGCPTTTLDPSTVEVPYN